MNEKVFSEKKNLMHFIENRHLSFQNMHVGFEGDKNIPQRIKDTKSHKVIYSIGIKHLIL